MLDMANYSLQFAIMLVWFEYAVLCGELHPHLRYDVYESCTTGSFCMTQARQLKMGEKMQDLSDFHESVDVVILAKKRWESYTAVSCILVCLQMLKNLDFHPRMGLVTRTMKKGAVDLTYFSLLFGFVNCIYAFLGTLIFGEEMAAYENFMMAFETCLRTVIGLYVLPSLSLVLLGPLLLPATTPASLCYCCSRCYCYCYYYYLLTHSLASPLSGTRPWTRTSSSSTRRCWH